MKGRKIGEDEGGERRKSDGRSRKVRREGREGENTKMDRKSGEDRRE